jgi:TetR/AcrR family transcriptional regulator
MDKSSVAEEKIIKAAAEVFMEKGKDGARMQEIADLAGINKALLHYYFRSKEKLFSKVVHLEFPKVISNIFESYDETDDFKIFLQSFINKYIDNIYPRKNMIKFLLWVNDKTKAEFAGVFEKAFKDRGFKKNPLVAKIDQAVKSGQIRPIDAPNFAMSVIGMCIFPIVGSPIVEKIFPGTKVNDKKNIEKRKNEIFNLVWNGIKAE